MCRCCSIVFFKAPTVQTWRISSLSSGETLTTQQCRGNVPDSLVLKYSVRIDTEPDMVMVCGTEAGIHTARWGGTTQAPSPVRTVITPRDA